MIASGYGTSKTRAAGCRTLLKPSSCARIRRSSVCHRPRTKRVRLKLNSPGRRGPRSHVAVMPDAAPLIVVGPGSRAMAGGMRAVMSDHALPNRPPFEIVSDGRACVSDLAIIAANQEAVGVSTWSCARRRKRKHVRNAPPSGHGRLGRPRHGCLLRLANAAAAIEVSDHWILTVCCMPFTFGSPIKQEQPLMPSLHKKLADFRELNPAEVSQVGGGAAAEETKTCYTDSRGREHCVRNYDDAY